MQLINEMSTHTEKKLVSDVCQYLCLQARASKIARSNFDRAIQIYKEADAIKADNDFWRSEWTTIFFIALSKAKELKIIDWETQWEVVRNALVSETVTEQSTQETTVQKVKKTATHKDGTFNVLTMFKGVKKKTSKNHSFQVVICTTNRSKIKDYVYSTIEAARKRIGNITTELDAGKLTINDFCYCEIEEIIT